MSRHRPVSPGKTPPGWAGLGSLGPLGHTQDALWLLRFEDTPIWSAEVYQHGGEVI